MKMRYPLIGGCVALLGVAALALPPLTTSTMAATPELVVAESVVTEPVVVDQVGPVEPVAEVPEPELSGSEDEFEFVAVPQNENKRIVWEGGGFGTLIRSYPKVADMAAAEGTKAIIKGKVVKTEDFFYGEMAFRVSTIEVAESFKSDVGPTVRVAEAGGVVPYSLLIPGLQDKTDEVLTAGPNDYASLRFNGQPHTEVGDEVFGFLETAPPNIKAKMNAEYNFVNSSEGAFLKPKTRSGNGPYVRVAEENPYKPAEVTLSEEEIVKIVTGTVGAAK